MSIVDSNVVDMIGVPSDDLSLVVMGISDHLDWGSGAQEHLLLLQEKINCYLRFVESGEIYDAFPSARGRRFVIEIIAKYEMNNESAKDFFVAAKRILEASGVELRYSFAP
ncbi:DUF6572 domain-containing protein [Ralstonia nicotianae]|uniref:Uncharacterized protein n=1 Tax=Ralstonia nicotianae TaxID=3037696 RepID=A0ABX8A0S0_9RALS|nr:DUF6572 domain-containing protein [Ralstonia nicotianae]QUP60707.1 hypothetical protein GO999_19400 [Ralstonia nicotianae]